ncbi:MULTISPECIES: class I SAM-dependent methyltransferase [unclassified Nocardioides]|uniref:class I SAM-dependent methyltransferase n=1 Tax=unclassified Nocardioides TaxID=2615069 RepID=UPI0036082A51
MDDHKQWLAGVFDRAAPTYDRVGTAYHAHFAGRLLDLAGPQREARLLDVACGRGAVLVAAAQRGLGDLTGIDVSPAMIELARADLAAAGCEAELRVMDAERLDFPDASFDVLTAAFALFFLPDPARAAAEFVRVLRPGGVVAVSTWGAEDERWAFEDDLLPAAGAPRRRALQQPFDSAEEVAALLGAAAVTSLDVQEEETEVWFATKEQWWDWHWSFSVRGILEQLTPEALAAYRDGCFREMDALETTNGFPLRLRALMVTGRGVR